MGVVQAPEGAVLLPSPSLTLLRMTVAARAADLLLRRLCARVAVVVEDRLLGAQDLPAVGAAAAIPQIDPPDPGLIDPRSIRKQGKGHG